MTEFGNTFMCLVHHFVLNTSYKDCWVCGLAPKHTLGRFPMIPVFLNSSLLSNITVPFPDDDQTWTDVKLGRPDYVLLTHKILGELCYKCNKSVGQFLGNSDCNFTHTKAGYFSRNGSFHRGYYHPLQDSYYNKRTFEDSLFCNKTTVALVNEYFICGNRAYKVLPPYWSGSCFVGSITPALRVTPNLPPGRVHNLREVTNEEMFLGLTVPIYGVALAIEETRRLTRILEEIANNTATVLDEVAGEVTQIRQMVLQNRMALDFLLADRGGVCALVGKDCWHYL